MKKIKFLKIKTFIMVVLLLVSIFSLSLNSIAILPYTVEDANMTQSQVDAKGDSIIKGKTPFQVYNMYEQINPSSGDNVLNMTDGILTTRAYYGGLKNSTANPLTGTITYDMGTGAVINEILVGGDDRGNSQLKQYEIFIGNQFDSLYTDINKIIIYINTTYSRTQLFTFTTAQTGRFFGIRMITPSFDLGDSMARIHELDIYGTAGVRSDNYDLNITQLQVDALGASIIKNKAPIKIVDGIDRINPDGGENVLNITDGQLSSRDYYYVMYYNGTNLKSGTFTYDLGVGANVSKILIGTDSFGLSQIRKYELYLSDDYNSLYTDTNKITAFENTSSSKSQLFTFGTNKTARFFGLKIITPSMETTDKMARIHEIGVYGIAGTPADFIDTNISQAEIDSMESSIIDGIAPFMLVNGDGQSNPAPGEDVLNMTDGLLSTRDYYANMYYNGTKADSGTITYDLGLGAVVEKLLIGTDNTGASQIKKYEIFLADDYDNLYTDANKIVIYDNTAGTKSQFFTFAASKMGRFLGIRIINPSIDTADKMARIHEIGIYGTAGIKGGNQETVETNLTQDQVNTLGVSINSGKAPFMIVNGYETEKPAGGEDVLHMTDGLLSTRDYYGAMYYNGSRADSGTVTYDLGAGAIINKILIATDNTANSQIKKYEIYIADKYKNLFTSDSKVIFYSNTKATRSQLFTFNEAKTGRFIGIRVIQPSMDSNDKMARIHEIAAYGTAGTEVIDNSVNLILNKLPIQIKQIVPFRPTSDLGEPSYVWDTAQYLTDGKDSDAPRCLLNGMPGPGGKIGQESYGFVIIFHLGGMAQIDEFSFISQMADGLQIALLDVYIGDKLSTVYDKDNLVYSSGNNEEKARTISSDANRQGKYIVFVINRPHEADYVGYGLARVNEISVRGTMLSVDPPKENPIFTDSITGIKAEISLLDPDDTFSIAKGIKITQTELSEDVVNSLNFANYVNVSDSFVVELIGANGNVLTADDIGARKIKIMIPKPTNNRNNFMFIMNIEKDKVPIVLNDSLSDDTYVIGKDIKYGGTYVPVMFSTNTAPVIDNDNENSNGNSENNDDPNANTSDRFPFAIMVAGVLLPLVSFFLIGKSKKKNLVINE
jgi:hypothetical protein